MEIIISIILGLVLAFIADKILFVGSFLSLLPWSIGGLIVGYINKKRKNALVNGFVYGFVLSLFFLIVGFQGNNLFKAIPLFVILGLFGGGCGVVLGFLGNMAHKLRV